MLLFVETLKFHEDDRKNSVLQLRGTFTFQTSEDCIHNTCYLSPNSKQFDLPKYYSHCRNCISGRGSRLQLIMSTRPGNHVKKKPAQKHKNATAFKFDKYRTDPTAKVLKNLEVGALSCLALHKSSFFIIICNCRY